MPEPRRASLRAPWLAVGDGLVYVVATMLGFANHSELVPLAWGRFLATLVSFALAWFLISPWILRARGSEARALARIFRPALAAAYAAPLGAWLRGLWIGAPIQVVFVAVMAGVTAILMAVWRGGISPLLSRSG